MNDDDLNYRFRLITFNDDHSIKNPEPKDKIPSVPEEPKPPKYSLSGERLNSNVPGQSTATPHPGRLSKSSTEVMNTGTAIKNEVTKKPRNTSSVQEFNQMITSHDNMYPDKLVDTDEVVTKDKNVKERIKIDRKRRKTQNHHKWQKDVKVIYTSETTKIPRRRKACYQPPERYAYQSHEFRGNFESLNNNDYRQNVFKNNPFVYFQSSGDCRKGIFSKTSKKSREKEIVCEHFQVADTGDFCEKEKPSSYTCIHLPHFNVIGFPQETKPKFQPPLQDHSKKCSRSLTTVNFKDIESDAQCKAVRSQPCPPVSHTYECETDSKVNYENNSRRARKTVSEAVKCECDFKNTSESKVQTSAKEKKKKTSVTNTKSKHSCPRSVTMMSRSTTPNKKSKKRSDKCIKYVMYSFAVIIFFPCFLVFSLCWLTTYPLRSRKAQPDFSKQCTQINNSCTRKPRQRNLCNFNIRQAVTCACRMALPSCHKRPPFRSCSPTPCSPSQCKEIKKASSKVSCNKEPDLDFYPIKIPSCAIKSYAQKHPDPSQQYRMFYGGALRGWLMKPLSCYGVTCKKKSKPYRYGCATTVMPVKTNRKKSKTPTKGKNKEKKAVKFSKEIATPMPETTQGHDPIRKGEMRPCTDPRPSKKPCKVCCQPIRPQFDSSNIGLVRYGEKKDDTKSQNPFKKNKKKEKKEQKKDVKKKKPKENSKKKNKGKKKKNKKKKKEAMKGLVKSIKDAEQNAWGNEKVKCDEIWVRTLRKRPCFWIYKLRRGLYPCFLQWHSCCVNCFSCCIMCLSTILWCPLLICVFICYKGFCKS